MAKRGSVDRLLPHSKQGRKEKERAGAKIGGEDSKWVDWHLSEQVFNMAECARVKGADERARMADECPGAT
eukprot:4782808-Pleurochrysis_carterae.AAC.1